MTRGYKDLDPSSLSVSFSSSSSLSSSPLSSSSLSSSSLSSSSLSSFPCRPSLWKVQMSLLWVRNAWRPAPTTTRRISLVNPTTTTTRPTSSLGWISVTHFQKTWRRPEKGANTVGRNRGDDLVVTLPHHSLSCRCRGDRWNGHVLQRWSSSKNSSATSDVSRDAEEMDRRVKQVVEIPVEVRHEFQEHDEDDDEEERKKSKEPPVMLDPSLYTTAIKIRMPDMDEYDGKVVKWYKKEGDVIQRDDSLCDIETDVFTFTMVTDDEEDALMGEVLVEENSKEPVETGEVLCIVYHKPDPAAAPTRDKDEEGTQDDNDDQAHDEEEQEQEKKEDSSSLTEETAKKEKKANESLETSDTKATP